MPLPLPITAAAGPNVDILLDIIFWLFFVGVAVMGMINNWRKAKQQTPDTPVKPTGANQRRATRRSPAGRIRPTGGRSPASTDISEIFERLSTYIPNTPKPGKPGRKQRAATAKQPMNAVEDFLSAVKDTADTSVETGAEDGNTLSQALHQSGMVLPELYAFGVTLSPWPHLPMEGMGNAAQNGPAYQIRLKNHRQLRDAVLAQMVLQPPKGAI